MRPLTASELLRGSGRIKGSHENDPRSNEEIIQEIHKNNRKVCERNAKVNQCQT